MDRKKVAIVIVLLVILMTTFKGIAWWMGPDPSQAPTFQNNAATLPNWHAALLAADTSRASITVIGDSVSDGGGSSDWDATAYPVVLRTALQARYGDGGEGFFTMLHYDRRWTGGPGDILRWSYPEGNWLYWDRNTGQGAVFSRSNNNGNATWGAETGFSGTSIQVMSGVNHSAGATMGIYVDGNLEATFDLRGDGNAAHLVYGQVVTASGLADASHALRLAKSGGTPNYVWAEGVRPLKGTAGVVVDRMTKPGITANALGTINESSPPTDGFYSLKSAVDVLDVDLFIIALGLNDYNNQIALNTFETQLDTIVQRAKAKADCVIVALPQPNDTLAIPYTSYITRMSNVATARGCAFLNVRERWGNTFKALWMTDTYHPNDLGHADIATFIEDQISR